MGCHPKMHVWFSVFSFYVWHFYDLDIALRVRRIEAPRRICVKTSAIFMLRVGVIAGDDGDDDWLFSSQHDICTYFYFFFSANTMLCFSARLSVREIACCFSFFVRTLILFTMVMCHLQNSVHILF